MLTKLGFKKSARLREDFKIVSRTIKNRWNPISPQMAVVWSSLAPAARNQITRAVGHATSKRVANYNRDMILNKLQKGGKLEKLIEKLSKDPNKPLTT